MPSLAQAGSRVSQLQISRIKHHPDTLATIGIKVESGKEGHPSALIFPSCPHDSKKDEMADQREGARIKCH